MAAACGTSRRIEYAIDARDGHLVCRTGACVAGGWRWPGLADPLAADVGFSWTWHFAIYGPVGNCSLEPLNF